MNSEKKIVNKKNTHVFRGLLTCVCGGNMTASPSKARVNGYTLLNMLVTTEYLDINVKIHMLVILTWVILF